MCPKPEGVFTRCNLAGFGKFVFKSASQNRSIVLREVNVGPWSSNVLLDAS